MRYALLLLLAPTLLATGCSICIAQAGKDPTDFASRDELHARLGPPIRTTTDPDGTVMEEFRSRQKYEEVTRSAGMGMGIAMTFGLGELVCFPRELLFEAKRIVFGQVLKYEFRPDGSFSVSIDGRSTGILRKRDLSPK